ncbi:hypothetical protein SAMN02745248_01273 [Hathewaya proteolytica DSM 3090]|uniref:Hybrid cluster protein-associated redox disulfide domain-containing protein n=1 Tax=Hathewaya proteolytica DSM 3090 TaxID=1121331 RepID=A0A1M6N5C3_9CLOT|nr:hypothetical protein [Hathewaya proteolytica]SHJ90836.1 hypothetical protein SAMN02745248_01273 [Hathewaya proteolytica DSM 3090]
MITGNMSLLDIVAKYPKTEEVFHEYDAILGKCLLCTNLFDSIEDIVKEYKLNSDELLQNLNKNIS